MVKKIILTLTIFITILVLISPINLAADDEIINVPQSATDPEQGFNELLNGESTITSNGDSTNIQSDVVGIGGTESQQKTSAGGFAAIGSLILGTINKLLSSVTTGGQDLSDNSEIEEYFNIQNLLTNKYPIFNINIFEETPSGPLSDLSNLLKQNAAIWYTAIRNLATIGCAIIVLYIGIRMAIASNAEDSAKYKKMLTSWLIGVVLLFLIHYILLIMIKFSELFVNFITQAIETDTGTSNMEESLLSGIPIISRSNISWGWGILYLILDCILVFYEIKFLIMYTFRVLRIFFMTIISPLMCLTYPIDTIGDGRAQGFNKWLRQILIDIFIQPIHLIIYVVFIFSAGEIAKEAPILGVVFIIALDNAERIIRNALKIKGKGLRDIKLFKGKGK